VGHYSSTPKRYDREMAAALYRMVSSVYFRPQHAPFCLASLIAVTPTAFVDHLELLGTLINEMHESTPDQKALAVHSAHRIAKHARYYLKQHFYRLSFGPPRARDTWLIDALIDPDGPFTLVRTLDVESPTLVLRDRPDQSIVLRHEHWTTYDRPPLPASPDSVRDNGRPWTRNGIFYRPDGKEATPPGATRR